MTVIRLAAGYHGTEECGIAVLFRQQPHQAGPALRCCLALELHCYLPLYVVVSVE